MQLRLSFFCWEDALWATSVCERFRMPYNVLILVSDIFCRPPIFCSRYFGCCKFAKLRRSSVGSLLRVLCWLGMRKMDRSLKLRRRVRWRRLSRLDSIVISLICSPGCCCTSFFYSPYPHSPSLEPWPTSGGGPGGGGGGGADAPGGGTLRNTRPGDLP